MEMTPKMNLLINGSALASIFIRIKNKRTICGDYFFRLDQLSCVSVIDNKGLTPLLEISGEHIDPSVSYEKFIEFITFVIDDANKNENKIKIYELTINDETVRELAPRTEKAFNG